MSSARFGGSIHGAGFGAAIADAGDPAAPQTEAKLKLEDAIFNLLSELPLSDATAREERSRLLGLRWQLNQETEAFLLRERQKARTVLGEQHEKLKAECLAQQKIIEGIKAHIAELQRDLDRARQLTARATADAREAQQARASLSRYASRAEISRADERFAHAEAKATERVHAEAPIAEEMNRLTLVDLDRAGKRLEELENQERDLSLRLSPQGGTNSLGFMVPPRR